MNPPNFTNEQTAALHGVFILLVVVACVGLGFWLLASLPGKLLTLVILCLAWYCVRGRQ